MNWDFFWGSIMSSVFYLFLTRGASFVELWREGKERRAKNSSGQAKRTSA